MEMLWPVAYFLGAVAGHALLTRLPLAGNSVSKFLLGGGLLGMGLCYHAWSLFGWQLAAAALLVSYAFMCELYLFLFTMISSSVSVKLLLTLRERDLAKPEIDKLYDAAGMVERRLERLLAVGLLEGDRTAYRVTGRGRKMVNTFRALKHFFRHADGPPTRRAA
jgi:hypothetical protein